MESLRIAKKIRGLLGPAIAIIGVDKQWSILVEGDEQKDWTKVEQEWNVAKHVLHNFFVFVINTTTYYMGRYSLHLLLLKSSMARLDHNGEHR